MSKMAESVLCPSLRNAGRGGGNHFSLMVAGESGLGKTTLLDSLFSTDHFGPLSTVQENPQRTLQLSSKKLEFEEITINLVDTPGFGVGLDDWDCSMKIMDYIDQQLER